MCLLVRDEADILDDQLAFHYAAGVDFVIATDHRSVDGTSEILGRYEAQGRLHVIREESEQLCDGEWRNSMARLAATDFDADWVIPSDADEFWWPRGGSLKELLGAVPPRFGVLTSLWRDFPYRPGEGSFAERMVMRLSLDAPLNDEAGPYHVSTKVAFRADADVVLQGGQHDVQRHRDVRVRAWYPLDVLHFPVRSRDQFERKFGRTGRGKELAAAAGRLDRPLSRHHAAGYAAVQEGRSDEWLARWTLDDRTLARGLEEGWLVEDMRLRDALRALRETGSLPPFPTFPLEPGLVADLTRLGGADALVHAEGRAEALELRVHALEAALARPAALGRLRLGSRR